VIGNEFADAIAKHAALHNYGHDKAFPPLSPDGNPFAHIYWLAEENNETTHTTRKEHMALFRTLLTPTNDLLPSLMVEVCLVLAPDVNFFLNSRK